MQELPSSFRQYYEKMLSSKKRSQRHCVSFFLLTGICLLCVEGKWICRKAATTLLIKNNCLFYCVTLFAEKANMIKHKGMGCRRQSTYGLLNYDVPAATFIVAGQPTFYTDSVLVSYCKRVFCWGIGSHLQHDWEYKWSQFPKASLPLVSGYRTQRLIFR